MIWNDISDPLEVILHETDIKDALNKRVPRKDLKPHYIRFRGNPKLANDLFRDMSKIMKTSPIFTLGCVVDKNKYFGNFPEVIGNDISLICMQIIIENFVHFLFKNNAVGKIVYESRDAMDKTMLFRFYQVASIGTIYIKPEAIQQRIVSFSFVHKYENSQCLQLADFIPNNIARKTTKKQIYNNVKNLTNNIFYKAYDGMNENKDRYGVKVVPRMK